jgi:predicted dehydrogenase
MSKWMELLDHVLDEGQRLGLGIDMAIEPAMPETILRIGILGAARIAPYALIRPARSMPEVQIAAIAARDPDRARRFARKHGIPKVHNSYAALIEDSNIDAVYNALPNSLHAVWTLRALQAGKHVLCEKPMASNAHEAARMAEAAQAAGRLLVEAFHYRYHPLALRMKEIIDSGELGHLAHFEASFCVLIPDPGNIRFRYDCAGGSTMDVGCYAINLLRYLAAAEPEVTQATARLLTAQIDRYMEADFRFPSGATGRFRCAHLSFGLFAANAKVI